MEEKKIVTGKEEKKASYEELNTLCSQLTLQNDQKTEYIKRCHKQMDHMAEIIEYKRIDYLFKVLELAEKTDTLGFSADFIGECVEEIESLLHKEEPSTETNPTDN